MEHRYAAMNDLDEIMQLVEQARGFMKKNGLDQWQDEYPTRGHFEDDIKGGYCHLLTEDDKIAAVITITKIPEECYEHLHEGAWINSGEYAAIHRATVSDKYRGRGLGAQLISLADTIAADWGVKSIRADTHENNAPMRSSLQKSGYTYCGKVFLEGPEKPRLERVVYEKIL